MPKVIFVDDDDILLEGLALSLRHGPFEFYSATTAMDAKSLMEVTEFDVVVSDISLPGTSGLDFLRHCALRWPDTIRIILSGNINTEATLQAINEIRVFKILTKPCLPSVLATAVEEALFEYQLSQGKHDLINIAIQHIQTNTPLASSANNPRGGLQLSNRNCSLSTQELELLSTREQEVLYMLLQRYRVPRVAELLFISQHTVRNHLKSIFNKLGVHSQQELIEKASPPPNTSENSSL